MSISLLEDTAGANLAVATRTAKVSFVIPAGEESKYFATHLSGDAQDDIRKMLNALCLINQWRSKMSVDKACERMARQKQAGMEFPPRGWDTKSLRRKFYEYTSTGKKKNGALQYHAGDWRILWDKAKYPEQKGGLPNKFVEELWKYLCEKNQRVCSAAHIELKKIYTTRFDNDGKYYETIPGYEVWPDEDAHTGLPEGWSLANLYRNIPTEFELEAARVGLAKASQLRLPVLKTRVGLRVGEYFQFDDHEYNLKVNYPGEWKAMRPRGFSVVDVLSGCYFKHSFKPTLWDESEERKKALTNRDFNWFVIDTLMSVGFRNDERGTTFVVEHALAAISDILEGRIHDVTGEKVKVDRSGRWNKKAHGGQYESAAPTRGKGNFKFKALIEVGWRLIDDALAGCKGQVGKDRNHAPEQLYGVDKYNQQLLDKAAVMTPEDAALILWPVMMWHEFTDRALAAWHQINWNHEHKLKDWEKLRFFKREWRRFVGDQWKSENDFLQISDEEKREVAALVQSQPETLTRTRKLSRQEVFDAGRNELTALSPIYLPTLVGYESGLGKEIPVRRGMLSFEDEEIGSGEFNYIARDEHGAPLNGKFLCFINPHNPRALVACTADKKVAAVCPFYDPACQNDEKALQHNLGLQNHFTASSLASQRARHEPDARKLEAMKQHNEAITTGRTVGELKADRSAAAALQKEVNARAKNGESAARKQNLASEAELARQALAAADEE